MDKYADIIKYIDEQEWEKARRLLRLIDDNDYNDTVAILEAEICVNLGEDPKSVIYKGLKYNIYNYELYFMLGNSLVHSNANQAYLCYEQAFFYCNNDEDKVYIKETLNNLELDNRIDIKPFSIVIISYNCKDMMVQCIESIRKNALLNTCEIVVVDNNSTDGIETWLREQNDIFLIENTENMGFGYACNQGTKAAKPDNDIFFLNNDTLITVNSIFNLRMGLYDNSQVGATGCVSNSAANNQRIIVNINTMEDMDHFAEQNNLPGDNVYEKKAWLVGFALFIKRTVLDQIGLFDLRFKKGNYEDNDLGLRITSAGYQMLLCHNSFIYHYGSQSFKHNVEEYKRLIIENGNKFKEKWGFDIRYYSYVRDEIIALIHHKRDDKFRVLEVGCGLGATLAHIKWMWPNAEVEGVEIVPQIANIGSKYLSIKEGNIENSNLSFLKNSYDYVIFADVLEHLHDPEMILKEMRKVLKPGGSFLLSIPNLMHYSVMFPMLDGKFDYQEAGILDRTHIHFFTLDSILQMINNIKMNVDKVSFTTDGVIVEDNQRYIQLKEILEESVFNQLLVYQYILKVSD